jgi:surface antigen
MDTKRFGRGTVPLTPALLLGVSAALTGCAGQDSEPILDKSTTGQVLGGVAGAAAGSQVGGGSGRTVSIIAGALLGSIVGERIGARMERDDLQQTAWALEENRTGETSAWVNPDTGNEFRVTPSETYDRSGRPCREFEFQVETARGAEAEERIACRNSDGTWEVIG